MGPYREKGTQEDWEASWGQHLLTGGSQASLCSPPLPQAPPPGPGELTADLSSPGGLPQLPPQPVLTQIGLKRSPGSPRGGSCMGQGDPRSRQEGGAARQRLREGGEQFGCRAVTARGGGEVPHGHCSPEWLPTCSASDSVQDVAEGGKEGGREGRRMLPGAAAAWQGSHSSPAATGEGTAGGAAEIWEVEALLRCSRGAAVPLGASLSC